MEIIIIKGLSKSFNSKPIFDKIDLSIQEGERIALFGQNGTGKTTLLNIIAGLETAEGEIRRKDINLGYLKQKTEPHLGKTVRDVLLGSIAADDYEAIVRKEVSIKKMFEGVNIPVEVLRQDFSSLSGGEKAKVQLVEALTLDSGLLLLDEPTNHLDIDSIIFLQKWLLEKFKGILIVVSHDRFFISKVADRIVEIENCKLNFYDGDYEDYVEAKKKNFEDATRRYETAQKEKKRLKASKEQKKLWIRKISKNKATIKEKYGSDAQMSRYRKAERAQKKTSAQMKHLERHEQEIKIQKPRGYQEFIKLDFQHEKSFNEVLEIKDVSKGIRKKLLFNNINFELLRGEKVFIIGQNGCGKTTLLNIIAGKDSPDKGTIKVGEKVVIGYLTQEKAVTGKKIIDYFKAKFPSVDEGALRDYLAKLLFRRDDIYKRINELSGGELMRINLLEVILNRCNFLLIDEPTNNLDLLAIEVLEDAMKRFDGTLLVVTHDREIIKNLAENLFVLKQDGLETISKHQILE